MEPSPTAVVTRFTEPTCTSPAAKTPGMLDSKGSGARVSWAGAGRALASQLTSGADVAFRVALQHASQPFVRGSPPIRIVVGGGNSAGQAAVHLSRLVRWVMLVARGEAGWSG